MPQTKLIFYRETDGSAPAAAWLIDLRRNNPKAYVKCAARLKRLSEFGYEHRRPEADLVRDGIYELRSRLGTVNYRALYFFHGRNVGGDFPRLYQRRQDTDSGNRKGSRPEKLICRRSGQAHILRRILK